MVMVRLMTKECISVRIDSDDSEFLHKLAEVTGRTVSFYVKEGIEEYIERIKREGRYDGHIIDKDGVVK